MQAPVARPVPTPALFKKFAARLSKGSATPGLACELQVCEVP